MNKITDMYGNDYNPINDAVQLRQAIKKVKAEMLDIAIALSYLETCSDPHITLATDTGYVKKFGDKSIEDISGDLESYVKQVIDGVEKVCGKLPPLSPPAPTKVLIHCDGGLVQSVTTDRPTDITLIDTDYSDDYVEKEEQLEEQLNSLYLNIPNIEMTTQQTAERYEETRLEFVKDLTEDLQEVKNEIKERGI